MALPNGFLDELKSRLSLAQVAGRKVTWDSRKSNPGRGDYWASCPFHQEKTASFHVEDAKGFYYCFGCHAKGDALSFVRETENVGFMEAVEILAREAGMTVPDQDPQAKAKAKQKSTLHDVMELAVKFYRLQINSAGASSARTYLDGRGLSAEIMDQFEIGFAPSGRTGLLEHLKSKGVEIKQMDEAGLIIIPDNGTPFDRFRDRIMFPIRDPRGKAIAFGGRAMAADAKAKYLNSPETPLFDKGNSLYNHSPAREAAGKSGTLIVAEGYMDVIALSSFGFAHAVAPLGTAITPGQLRLMWRITDEPIIALDGDKAGIRAAMRLIDIALPLLSAGKSLRFALMPDGLDPDDLLRASGPPAMEKLLNDARPLASLVWQRETQDKQFDSPERRAALDANLKRLLGTIEDASIRDHYRAYFRERRSELFAPSRTSRPTFPQNPKGRANGPRGPAPRPTIGAKGSILAKAASTDAEARIRELSILRLCLHYPDAADKMESALETLPIHSPDLTALRDAVLTALPDATEVPTEKAPQKLREIVASRVPAELIETVLRSGLTLPALPEDAHDDLMAQIQRHRAIIGRTIETRDAEQEILAVEDEGVTWRQQEALRVQEEAARLGFDEMDGDSEENARNSAFLTQMVEEARKNSKKS